MKQTAVEWFIEQLPRRILYIYQNEIEQAKAMEKEQIVDAYCQGCLDITNNDIIFPRETSEQYYNETFKSE